MREDSTKNTPGLVEIFIQFLKIGLSAFGGYTALLAVVQKNLVEKRKWLSEQQVLESISIASILPGPLAVNVIAYAGYSLRGWLGALISMTAVLLPSYILLLFAAIGLSRIGNVSLLSHVIGWIIPVIVAIIISVGIGLYQKQLKLKWQHLIFAGALMASFFLRGYWIIVVMILSGGLFGLLFSKESSSTMFNQVNSTISNLLKGLGLLVALFIIAIFFSKGTIIQDLIIHFSKVSLTLFGGGYVMIPLLFDLIVDTLGWVSPAQFSTAIAVGQITPGPILISAAFIGYEVGGIAGSITATIAIFLPSAMLMILFADTIGRWGNSFYYKRFMQGVYPVVIALILFSCYTLMSHLDDIFISVIIVIVSFLIIQFTRISYLYLVLIMGLFGLLMTL